MKDYTAFFNTFGYDTDAGCDICGAKPCKTEPRFGYTTCKTHCIISPLEFSQTREGIIKDTTKMKTDKEMLKEVIMTIQQWEGKFRKDGWSSSQLRLHRELSDKISNHLKTRHFHIGEETNDEW